jgi:hypothetical protein
VLILPDEASREMTITLSEHEARIAKWIGKERTAINRRHQVGDQRRSVDLSGEEVDIDGMGAEMALAKMLNVYPDFGLSPRHGGMDALWGGVGVDVKTTRYPDGRLIATPLKSAETGVALYALLVGRLPTYEFKGFVTATQLFAVSRLTDLGHGPTYAVKQAELAPLTADDLRW